MTVVPGGRPAVTNGLRVRAPAGGPLARGVSVSQPDSATTLDQALSDALRPLTACPPMTLISDTVFWTQPRCTARSSLSTAPEPSTSPAGPPATPAHPVEGTCHD